ncbi:hypothetical protein DID88_007535 [Monilinia fructigena]|uniref:Major facilitator superfamily (MFS) profile domain-containing protein n=1 Tax=Monilinia fructigena TaxID=38457 RepID=A0A395J2Q1_9HELO|nr:hypothetical protein DID88_007535 [Monilinia fructigena]
MDALEWIISSTLMVNLPTTPWVLWAAYIPPGANLLSFPCFQSVPSSVLLLPAFSSDYFGRRNTILIGCVIYCVGVLLQVAHPSIGLLAAGRTVAGFGIGFVSANIVAFQTEICPKRIRGPCISMYQFGITIGLLIASGVNQGTKDIKSNASFQIPIVDAQTALCRLRGRDVYDRYLIRELDLMVEQTKEEMAAANGGWIDCFTGGFHFGSNLFRTFIGTTVQMMQQLTGVNFIFYYGTTYFAQVGLSGVFLLATITNLVNVVSTPVSFWTIERFGRRPLLIYGGAFMAVCEFIIAIVGTVLSTDKTAQVVLFVFVCLHIVGFASTWGPTGWAVSGEMFPLAIRGRGIALNNANLKAKVFYIFGATCAISTAFAYFFIYETKGLSLEQIDLMCADSVGKNPRYSAQFSRDERSVAAASGIDTETGRGEMSQRGSKSSASKDTEQIENLEKTSIKSLLEKSI